MVRVLIVTVVSSKGPPSVKDLVSLLPLVGIALVFWLLLIRPQQRRVRELGALQQSLTVGEEIILTSGVYGVVRRLEDDHARVEIAPGVEIKVARGAVGGVVRPDAASDEPTRPEES